MRTDPPESPEEDPDPRERGEEDVPPAELAEIADKLADTLGLDIERARRAAPLISLPMAMIPNAPTSPWGFWHQILLKVHSGASPVGSGRLAVTRFRAALASSGPVGKASIFLSYSRGDQPEVDRLYGELKAAAPKLEVFQDHRCLKAGRPWLESIERHAGRSSAMVCWLTESFLTANFPHYEIGVARRSQARIIPVVRKDGLWQRAPAYLSREQGILALDPVDYCRLARRILRAIGSPDG